MAVTLSLEDFVITFFVAGPGSSTLPLRHILDPFRCLTGNQCSFCFNNSNNYTFGFLDQKHL